jgi:hypothetical protein
MSTWCRGAPVGVIRVRDSYAVGSEDARVHVRANFHNGMFMGRLRAARRSGRDWFVLYGVLGGILVAFVATSVATTPPSDIGIDFVFYRSIGFRWLADGTYYLPHQLTGRPYDLAPMADVLYPPHALLLFLPLTVLPSFLWWAIPVGVTLYVLRSLRPAPWAIAAILALMIWPRAYSAFLFGNSDMWAVAGVAAGIRWGWPAILLTIKPSLAPLVLVGFRHRSWWVGLALLALVTLTALPSGFEYVTAVRNVRVDPWYSLGSLPLLCVPLVAWLSAGPRREIDGRVIADV